MASISIAFNSLTGAISNKFVVQLLNENNEQIDRFVQNQTIVAIGIGNVHLLTVNIPDGVYSYPILKVRIFSDSIDSGIYTDIIETNFVIDCDGNVTSTSTTQRITTTTTKPVTTTVPVTTTTVPITTSSTTVGTTTTVITTSSTTQTTSTTIPGSTTTILFPEIVNLYAFETAYTPPGQSTTVAPTTSTTTQPITTTSTSTTVNPAIGNAYFDSDYGEADSMDKMFQLMPFVPSGAMNWEFGVAVKYLSNNDIKVGWTKGIGGAITHMIRGNGYNRVNTNFDIHSDFEGNQIGETGRSAGGSFYATPRGGPIGFGNPFFATGSDGVQQRTDQDGDDTGWNPVHGGSREARDRSIVRRYERRTIAGLGEVDYLMVSMYHWSLHGILAECDVHCYYWIVGKVLEVRFIMDLKRTDTQMIFQASQQEFFNYVVGTLYNQKIRKGLPGTNSPLINIKKPAPCDGAGQPGCPNQTDTGIYFSTEHFLASVDDNDDGVITVMRCNNRVHGKQFQGYFGNEFTNASGYQNHAMMVDFDNNGISAFGQRYFIGTIGEFDQWQQANPEKVRPMKPDWLFKPNQKRAWWSDGAPCKFNGNGEYVFNIGQDIFCKFRSPFISIIAAQNPKFYAKVKITNGLTKLRLKWIRSTDENENDNEVVVDCVGDGQIRTYVFDLTQSSRYNGVIINFMLGMGYNFDQGGLLNHTEQLVPLYLGTVNPG